MSKQLTLTNGCHFPTQLLVGVQPVLFLIIPKSRILMNFRGNKVSMNDCETVKDTFCDFTNEL